MSDSTPPDLPPPPRPVTEADRETFAARVRASLTALGMSQRKFERHIGMSHGELSKLFSGTKRIVREVLDEIAPVLRTTPENLVAGTALADVLRTPPTTVESARITELVQQLDEARAHVAAAEARATVVANELKDMTRERDAAREELTTARQRLEQVEGEVQRASRTVSQFKQTAFVASMAKTGADVQLRDLRAQLAQTQAALATAATQLATWREYAQALEPTTQQVRDLAAENEQLRAQLAQAQGSGPGTLLVGGLLGAAVTALAGANDKQPYRRR